MFSFLKLIFNIYKSVGLEVNKGKARARSSLNYQSSHKLFAGLKHTQRYSSFFQTFLLNFCFKHVGSLLSIYNANKCTNS